MKSFHFSQFKKTDKNCPECNDKLYMIDYRVDFKDGKPFLGYYIKSHFCPNDFMFVDIESRNYWNQKVNIELLKNIPTLEIDKLVIYNKIKNI